LAKNTRKWEFLLGTINVNVKSVAFYENCVMPV